MIDKLCEHIEHENGIHEIMLYRGTRQGVDCYIEQVGALFDRLSSEDTLRYILNATVCDQLPPINYFVNRSNTYQQEHSELGQGRLVILYNRTPFWTVISSIINMLNIRYRGALVMKMIEGSKREQAIEWLLDNR